MTARGDTLTPWDVLRLYRRTAGVHFWHLAIPLGLVLLASAFDGAAFLLLVPLTKSVGANSFDPLETSRLFGWIPRLLSDRGVPPSDRDVWVCLITVALIVLGRIAKLGCDYLRILVVVARNERYRIAVSAMTFDRVLAFGRQYFERQPLGAIDAEVQWGSAIITLLGSAEEAIRYGINLFVKAGVMFAISVPLSLAFTITLPAVGWFLQELDRRVTALAVAGMDADRTVRSRILDILGSIPLIKVNSQEREASRTYVDAVRELGTTTIRRSRVTNLRYPLEEAFVLIVMLAVQGTVMFIDGDFSPGDLATFGAFLLIVQQALPDFKWLSMHRTRVLEEWPRLSALTRLFTDEGKYIVPSGPTPFVGVREAITLHDLSFCYDPGVPALSDVRATLRAGTVTAIVGRTGAGKTTLVDLIARLYDCPPGSIRIDGVDIRDFALPTLHARMALVSQDVWLLNRTLRDNLTFGLATVADDASLRRALEDVELGDFLAGLREGLDTELGDRGVRLSGGERQRVALARALLRDPDILILDEATAALDSVVEQRVARAIQQRAAGRTLIVIAHRLSTVRDADLILVMDDGRVVEQGTWDTLLAQPGRFRALHDAQFGAP